MMMEQEGLYKRFIKCEWRQQLGNLASTLARLSTLITEVGHEDTSKNLLREATLLIEWCAPNVPQRLHNDLAFIQRELCYYRRIPLQVEIRKLLSLRSRIISDHLLDVSGLLSY